MATRIDGFLNPTLFRAPGAAAPGDPVLALGRRKMGGGLAVCRVAPAVAHAAYVDQPEGHMLEDPRYLGAWDGAAAFVCADAIEYFEGKPDWRIHQAVLYLDAATWTVRGVWRLEGRARGEELGPAGGDLYRRTQPPPVHARHHGVRGAGPRDADAALAATAKIGCAAG